MDNWDNPLQFNKHLGGNFWLLTSGEIYNTTSNIIIKSDQLPPTMMFEESLGSFPIYMYFKDFPKENGMKFVTFDFVTDFSNSKSGKTRYAKFENFDLIDKGSYKIGEKWADRVDRGFEYGSGYIFFFEVHSEYPSGLNLIKYKKLNHDRKSALEETT